MAPDFQFDIRRVPDGELWRQEVSIAGRPALGIAISCFNGDSGLNPPERHLVESIYRLRYDIYCGESGYASPNADHERRQLRDGLDDTAIHLILVVGDEVVGASRINLLSKSDIGDFVHLLSIDRSPYPMDRLAMVTKFVVRRDFRGTDAGRIIVDLKASLLYAAGALAAYMDSRVEFHRLYKRIGFVLCGEPFTHYETGNVWPMCLDMNDFDHLISVGSSIARNPLFQRAHRDHMAKVAHESQAVD